MSWWWDEYEHLDHGYAITAHAAQGVTVDRALVLLDESMSDLHWSYVAASRSRLDTELYVQEGAWEDVRELMAQVRQKESTLDYAVVRPPTPDGPEAEFAPGPQP